MQLLPALALGGVQGLHPADIIPHIRADGGGRYRHKFFADCVPLLQRQRQGNVLIIVIDMGQAVLPEPAHSVAHFQSGQLVRVKIAVPAGTPEGVGIQLPLAQGVILLLLGNPLVCIGL